MQNPEPFDPLKVGRYTVIRLEVPYPNQPSAEKLFVALRHHKYKKDDCILCLKTTSKAAKYENDPDALKGCVLYDEGQIPFFPTKTVIEVSNPHRILHDFINERASNGKYRIEGKMPPDFHAKLVNAITHCDVYNENEKQLLLEAIGA